MLLHRRVEQRELYSVFRVLYLTLHTYNKYKSVIIVAVVIRHYPEMHSPSLSEKAGCCSSEGYTWTLPCQECRTHTGNHGPWQYAPAMTKEMLNLPVVIYLVYDMAMNPSSLSST